MNQADLKRAKELSQSLRKVGIVGNSQRIRPKKVTSSFQYKSLGGAKPIWDSSTKVTPKAIVKKAVPSPFKVQYETLVVKDGEDGKTPVKGVDYFTEQEKNAFKQELLTHIMEDHQELVDKITEHIKGSISMKDIKDTESFVMKTREGLMTRYKFEELMHGGGSSGSLGTPFTPVGTVDAVNAVFTVTAEPTSVISDGITYFDGAGYTYAALTITMDIPPSSYIRYYV